MTFEKFVISFLGLVVVLAPIIGMLFYYLSNK